MLPGLTKVAASFFKEPLLHVIEVRNMATKKSPIGGVLGFLGSLVYLYVIFTWYGSTGAVATGTWLAAAQFLMPFVIAAAIFASISLFFMNVGAMAGKMGAKMSDTLWKVITWAALTMLILSGGTGYFFGKLFDEMVTEKTQTSGDKHPFAHGITSHYLTRSDIKGL